MGWRTEGRIWRSSSSITSSRKSWARTRDGGLLAADDAHNACAGIADHQCARPVNVDFEDVKTAMSEHGRRDGYGDGVRPGSRARGRAGVASHCWKASTFPAPAALVNITAPQSLKMKGRGSTNTIRAFA
jgi:cell division GTPase FtsZ